ncbi:hypothetical protein RSOL_224530 [Rhizoctonia solani AG-3 Rhs1AP]|uniref:Uncharacterized protein n=1 Tax=Rhizoctonia solani AG-3 Rhs1AP TaxID=1086054 RepID=X8J5L0_9AGAM|nr:hypothetical protein RSOL_224530 [Rhizoctonia solani AG-3 Rhs1AP]
MSDKSQNSPSSASSNLTLPSPRSVLGPRTLAAMPPPQCPPPPYGRIGTQPPTYVPGLPPPPVVPGSGQQGLNPPAPMAARGPIVGSNWLPPNRPVDPRLLARPLEDAIPPAPRPQPVAPTPALAPAVAPVQVQIQLVPHPPFLNRGLRLKPVL